MPPLLHQVFRPVPFCTYYRMAEIADTRRARLQPRAGFKLAAVWTYLGVLPFFVFIIAFLIFPATNLFAGAFQDAKGNFTLVNIQGLFSPYILKAYRTSLEVSLITSLSGGCWVSLWHMQSPWARRRAGCAACCLLFPVWPPILAACRWLLHLLPR
ncbi:hypothetical protein EMGBS1_05200 [Chloroflexota bacterium]|nr:hypothetical protein EMGBS1_05200 [Chloroflexota bacterium]